MKIRIRLDIRDENGTTIQRAVIEAPEDISKDEFVRLVQDHSTSNQDIEYLVLVEWGDRPEKRSILYDGCSIIVQPKPREIWVLNDDDSHRKELNTHLAGDSTTDAPPPVGKKKNRKGINKSL
jgi:hypothetical protein